MQELQRQLGHYLPNNISCVSEWHTDALVQWTSQSNTNYQHTFISVNSISCCRRGALSLLQLFDVYRQLKIDSLPCTRTCTKKQEQLDRAYALALREHAIDLGWCWHIELKPQPSYRGNIANPHYHINQDKLVLDTMTQCPLPDVLLYKLYHLHHLLRTHLSGLLLNVPPPQTVSCCHWSIRSLPFQTNRALQPYCH